MPTVLNSGWLTNYAEQKLHDHIFAGVPYQPPALWLRHGTPASAEWDETGTGGTEPNPSTGYAPIDLSAAFGPFAGGVVSNNVTVPGWTALSTFSVVNAPAAIFDDPTAGNCLAYLRFVPLATLLAGQRWRFPTGWFQFSWHPRGYHRHQTFQGTLGWTALGQKKLLEHFFRVAYWTPALQVALGTVSYSTELFIAEGASYPGYARQPLPAWNAAAQAVAPGPSGGTDLMAQAASTADLLFPPCSANCTPNPNMGFILCDGGGPPIADFEFPFIDSHFMHTGDRLGVASGVLQALLD